MARPPLFRIQLAERHLQAGSKHLCCRGRSSGRPRARRARPKRTDPPPPKTYTDTLSPPPLPLATEHRPLLLASQVGDDEEDMDMMAEATPANMNGETGQLATTTSAPQDDLLGMIGDETPISSPSAAAAAATSPLEDLLGISPTDIPASPPQPPPSLPAMQINPAFRIDPPTFQVCECAPSSLSPPASPLKTHLSSFLLDAEKLELLHEQRPRATKPERHGRPQQPNAAHRALGTGRRRRRSLWPAMYGVRRPGRRAQAIHVHPGRCKRLCLSRRNANEPSRRQRCCKPHRQMRGSERPGHCCRQHKAATEQLLVAAPGQSEREKNSCDLLVLFCIFFEKKRRTNKQTHT